jgi:pyruvate/2-oxoglutarate dehydrogenase complex dihydrolipoamide acyltransferase (E2) component
MSGARIEVRIEDPGDTVEVEVIAVLVEQGATVAKGDPLLEVATDKANADIDAPADGTVDELLVAEGDIVHVSEPLVILTT